MSIEQIGAMPPPEEQPEIRSIPRPPIREQRFIPSTAVKKTFKGLTNGSHAQEVDGVQSETTIDFDKAADEQPESLDDMIEEAGIKNDSLTQPKPERLKHRGRRHPQRRRNRR